MGDKAFYESLKEMVCDKHATLAQCESAKAKPENWWNWCVMVRRREFLLKRGRLFTGKTR